MPALMQADSEDISSPVPAACEEPKQITITTITILWQPGSE